MTEETKKQAKAVAPKKTGEKKAAPKKAESVKAEASEAKKPAAKKTEAKREKKADSGVKKQGKLVDDVRLYDVIKHPLITEKTTMAAEQGKVVFAISADANKQDVKKAVEALFGVKVVKVNTVLTKGKQKRFRGRPGQRSDQRKAIVTLAAGQSIDLAAGLK